MTPADVAAASYPSLRVHALDLFRERGEAPQAADVEDLVQETLLRFLERGCQIRTPGLALAWSRRVMRNLLNDRGRRLARFQAFPLEVIPTE